MREQERPATDREAVMMRTRDHGGILIAVLVLLFVTGLIAFFSFGGYFEKASGNVIAAPASDS